MQHFQDGFREFRTFWTTRGPSDVILAADLQTASRCIIQDFPTGSQDSLVICVTQQLLTFGGTTADCRKHQDNCNNTDSGSQKVACSRVPSHLLWSHAPSKGATSRLAAAGSRAASPLAAVAFVKVISSILVVWAPPPGKSRRNKTTPPWHPGDGTRPLWLTISRFSGDFGMPSSPPRTNLAELV